MKITIFLLLAGLACLQAAPAGAENYEVSLTRKGSDVYRVDGGPPLYRSLF